MAFNPAAAIISGVLAHMNRGEPRASMPAINLDRLGSTTVYVIEQDDLFQAVRLWRNEAIEKACEMTRVGHYSASRVAYGARKAFLRHGRFVQDGVLTRVRVTTLGQLLNTYTPPPEPEDELDRYLRSPRSPG